MEKGVQALAVNSFREDEEQKVVLNRNTIKRLFSYLMGYKKTIVIVLLLIGVTTAVALVNPLMIERAINVHIKNGDSKGLMLLSLFACILNIIFLYAMRKRITLMEDISTEIVENIRYKLYVHIQELSLYFFDSRPTGKILSRITGDVNNLKDVLSSSVTTIIPSICTIVCVLVIMFIKNWRLAMAAVVTLPILIIGTWVIQTIGHKKWQVEKRKSSNLNAFVHESLSGIKIIQSFCAEKETNATFDELVNEHKLSYKYAVAVGDLLGSLIEFTWGFGGFLLYFIAIKYIGVEQIEVGTILAFATYLGMFWAPIRNIANFYNKLITNISAAERVFEVMDIEPDIKEIPQAKKLPLIHGDVCFDHVTFSYPGAEEKTVLNHISFFVDAGKTIALVGPTGAGKSSIVNLISRFYDINSGHILVDGIDISTVTIESLRKQMGVMTQDNFLFTGTIKENIRYGKLDATDEEIIEAAKAVHAHEFIREQEHGYDTVIGERGGNLSVGQKQLLAFARTMISKPAILILDEATSNIDTHTEELIQKGIEALLKDRTSFVIAHRLSTIQHADCIFVIDNGTIKEMGSHTQLLEQKGQYYQLYMAQFQGEQ